MAFLKKLLFPHFPRIASKTELSQKRQGRIRLLVARFAGGNIALQQGIYLTAQRAEQIREQNKKYEF